MKDKLLRYIEQICIHAVIAIILLLLIAFIIGCFITLLNMPDLIKWLININGFA